MPACFVDSFSGGKPPAVLSFEFQGSRRKQPMKTLKSLCSCSLQQLSTSCSTFCPLLLVLNQGCATVAQRICTHMSVWRQADWSGTWRSCEMCGGVTIKTTSAAPLQTSLKSREREPLLTAGFISPFQPQPEFRTHCKKKCTSSCDGGAFRSIFRCKETSSETTTTLQDCLGRGLTNSK